MQAPFHKGTPQEGETNQPPPGEIWLVFGGPMANRYFYEFLSMFEKRPVMLFGNISIGATGAPTLNTNSRGIKSVTRISAGVYDVILEDPYTKLIHLNSAILSATLTDAALNCLVTTDAVTAAIPKVRITFAIAAGTATDPSNGATLLLKILLRNSSAPV